MEISCTFHPIFPLSDSSAVRGSPSQSEGGKAARGTTGMRANGGVWVVVYGAEIAEIRLAALLTRPSIGGCVARAPLVTTG